MQVRPFGQRLIAAVLPPPRCGACDAQMSAPARPFCDACAETVLPLRSRDPGATGAFAYVGAVARALARLKSERRPDLGRVLGDLLWCAVEPQAASLRQVVLVPVPLHPARLAERGFNQSGLLARRVARRLGAPLWPSALTRTRDTPPQATLTRDARRANVRDAFVAREPEHVAGRAVLLVDDVSTSGATLDACSRALLDAGARTVFRSVLARAGY
jgi:ComF family protein